MPFVSYSLQVGYLGFWGSPEGTVVFLVGLQYYSKERDVLKKDDMLQTIYDSYRPQLTATNGLEGMY